MEISKMKDLPVYVEGIYKYLLECKIPFEEAAWMFDLINKYPLKDKVDFAEEIIQFTEDCFDLKDKYNYYRHFKLQAENLFAAVSFFRNNKKRFSFSERKYHWALIVTDKTTGRQYNLDMSWGGTRSSLFALSFVYPGSENWDKWLIDNISNNNLRDCVVGHYIDNPDDGKLFLLNLFQLCPSPEMFEKMFLASLSLMEWGIYDLEHSIEYYEKKRQSKPVK